VQWDDLLSDIEEAKRVMAETQKPEDQATRKAPAATMPVLDLGGLLKRLFPQQEDKASNTESQKVLKRK
jgi:hypothetical protein